MSSQLKRVLGDSAGLFGLTILLGRTLILAPYYDRPSPPTSQTAPFSIGFKGVRSRPLPHVLVQVSASMNVTLQYPKYVPPENSFSVDALVTLKDAKVEGTSASSGEPVKLAPAATARIQAAADRQYRDFLKTGAVGLTLRLAGAEIQPKEQAPIVESRASWSVKPNAKGQLNGFLSPLAMLSPHVEVSSNAPGTDFSYQLTDLTLSGTQPMQITVRPHFSETLWNTATYALGTLLTIPGLVAFFLDLQKRRDERRKREQENRRIQEEERAKAERERKIFLP